MQEYEIISGWIKPHARVLDLGCGNGKLLEYLTRTKQINGYGLEISAECIAECISRGVSVIEQNFDNGLDNFPSSSFDVVLLASTLQATARPDILVKEMLRIGTTAIVTFPNFSHWVHRFHLLFQGKMPVSKFLPYEWYDTPNIHHCTIKDFNNLCATEGINIVDRKVEGMRSLVKLSANLWGRQAMYLIRK